MSRYDDDFFAGKRTWSLIKDRILASYVPAYVNKVKRLDRPIVLIDGYAGPGIFEDGHEGSPLIICSAAEKYAKGHYSAHFFNVEKKFHEKLESMIKSHGWSHSAHCYLGNSLTYINQIPQILKNHTVFLYLDPFGLKGCGFDQLEPFLVRDASYSTEIVLTMCMPVVHRLASRHAIKKGQEDEKIKSYHLLLTKVFGGEYWKDILLYQQNVAAEDKEFQLIKAYLAKLKQFLPYTGCCPIRQNSDKRIKYFVVFVSRHSHAMLLMNDIMHKEYFSSMHVADNQGTLFGELDWKDMPMPEKRSVKQLKDITENLVSQHPGESRSSIWLKVVQANFMDYYHSDYLEALKQLANEKKLLYQVDPQTKRHNDNSKLFPTT